MNDAARTTDTVTGAVRLTESAAQRIGELIADGGNPDLMLRLAVEGGGCSGFQYHFSLDDRVAPDDRVYEHHGARMVVDEVSIGLLDGAQVDFVRDLVGASFQVKNPNAASSCGCGASFAI